MITRPIRPLRFIAAAVLVLWMASPATALAAVSPDAASAASAGLKYLNANQNLDGSIKGGGLGESEWSAMAAEAGGRDISAFSNGGASLLDFLKTDAPGTSTTAIERKIIAINAAGQDSAGFGVVDYDALLGAQQTGGQIGDPTLLNDDFFGIIAIDSSHDSALLPEAQDALNYLLAHQDAGGGFSYTTDTCAWCGPDSSDTAAAIIAMYAASDLGLGSPSVDAARSEALTYLLNTQQADGGFGGDASGPSDGSSTSWDLMALNTIGAPASASAAKARDWLLSNQNPDGGFSYGAFGYTTSDTYTTAGAVTALLGTTWLLKPAPTAPVTGTGGGSGVTGQPAQPAAAQASPPQRQTPQPVTTVQMVSVSEGTGSSPYANNDGAEGQVKAASLNKPAQNPIRPAAKRTGPDARHSYIYFAALLGAIAVAWFVLESRKVQRGKI